MVRSARFELAAMANRERKSSWLFRETHTDDGGDVSCEVKLLGSVVGFGLASKTQIL